MEIEAKGAIINIGVSLYDEGVSALRILCCNDCAVTSAVQKISPGKNKLCVERMTLHSLPVSVASS